MVNKILKAIKNNSYIEIEIPPMAKYDYMTSFDSEGLHLVGHPEGTSILATKIIQGYIRAVKYKESIERALEVTEKILANAVFKKEGK